MFIDQPQSVVQIFPGTLQLVKAQRDFVFLHRKADSLKAVPGAPKAFFWGTHAIISGVTVVRATCPN
jgi:hypothetical protein